MDMKTFVISAQLEYRESQGNNQAVNKFYELKNPGGVFNSIPDACIDIEFISEDKGLVPYACGTFLESTDSSITGCSFCFGVKLNPGIVPKCMRSDAATLIGGRKRMDDCTWLMELAELLYQAQTFEERIEIFEKHFPYDREIVEENTLVKYIMERIQKEKGCQNIASLANEMGYSQKYMDRVFRGETGLTMKKYATIIRIQAAIHYLQEGRWDEVYEKLGYYDQSHFIKDFKRYTGLTPKQYSFKERYTIV